MATSFTGSCSFDSPDRTSSASYSAGKNHLVSPPRSYQDCELDRRLLQRLFSADRHVKFSDFCDRDKGFFGDSRDGTEFGKLRRKQVRNRNDKILAKQRNDPKAFSDLLEKRGFKVVVNSDGTEALRDLDSSPTPAPKSASRLFSDLPPSDSFVPSYKKRRLIVTDLKPRKEQDETMSDDEDNTTDGRVKVTKEYTTWLNLEDTEQNDYQFVPIRIKDELIPKSKTDVCDALNVNIVIGDYQEFLMYKDHLFKPKLHADGSGFDIKLPARPAWMCHPGAVKELLKKKNASENEKNAHMKVCNRLYNSQRIFAHQWTVRFPSGIKCSNIYYNFDDHTDRRSLKITPSVLALPWKYGKDVHGVDKKYTDQHKVLSIKMMIIGTEDVIDWKKKVNVDAEAYDVLDNAMAACTLSPMG